MQLGEVLHIFRVANEISIKDAAKEADYSTAYMNKIERCSKVPSYDTIKTLATIYNVRGSQIIQMHEDSCSNNWDYSRTLNETLSMLKQKSERFRKKDDIYMDI